MLVTMKLSRISLLSAALVLTASAFSQKKTVTAKAIPWPTVVKENKPWTRWWWMGNAVDKENISSLLKTYSAAGIGGVEIVPIYGAKGYESRYLNYLSPQWFAMVDYSVTEAAKNNMGTDIAVGTGWPIGGPQAGIADAATCLLVQRYTLKAGEAFNQKIKMDNPKQANLPGVTLQALVAYGEDSSAIDITAKVTAAGELNWTPPNGSWELYAAFAGKTLQQVKRAAPGGEGYTLDHFSKTALQNYLNKTDSAYGKTSHGVRSFYNDSYEVYGANWTADFFAEFQKRRGYDLKLYLRELTGTDVSDKVARIKCDYRETMADLMLENFTHTYSNWAHGKKAFSLNQAHGSPGNLLDLYAGVDIAEAETFGSSYFPIPGLRRDSADVRNVDPDPNMLKFASSAAHVTGHPLASSETFTWLTEHFKTGFSQCKPEVEQVFLSGINHVFFHGTTYSPASAPWPGWLFYASVNFVPSNSLWPHLNGLNDYITRCQSVLQSGKPDNEIAIYWPVFDAWQNPKGMDMPLKVHDIDEWLHPTAFYASVTGLQAKGFSLDFVSDRMLQKAYQTKGLLQVTPQGAGYKVLLVPKATHIPPATFEQFIRLAKEGTTVIIQQLPDDVPGFQHAAENRAALLALEKSINSQDKGNGIAEAAFANGGRIIICSEVETALAYASVKRERLTDSGLKFIRRAAADGKYYYLVNHTAHAVDTILPFNTAGESVLLMDPQTGSYGTVASTTRQGVTEVRIQLAAGEAIIVKTGNATASKATKWAYINKTSINAPVLLNGEWKLHFAEGGPSLPSDKTLSAPVQWSSLPDTAVQNFSGTAVYSTSFTLPAGKMADDYLLLPGKINESAKVWINGKYAGMMWSNPYQLRAGRFLKPGTNTITFEVANLMANRIRYMDRNGITWRNYHEINFVNINYKNFDASGWKVQPSGMEGPVVLMPVTTANK